MDPPRLSWTFPDPLESSLLIQEYHGSFLTLIKLHTSYLSHRFKLLLICISLIWNNFRWMSFLVTVAQMPEADGRLVVISNCNRICWYSPNCANISRIVPILGRTIPRPPILPLPDSAKFNTSFLRVALRGQSWILRISMSSGFRHDLTKNVRGRNLNPNFGENT